MMKHSMILIAVLAAAALVAMVATRQLAVKQQASQIERNETSAPADITIGLSIEKTPAGSILNVSMSPKEEEEVAVSTFALELTVARRDGTPIQTAGQIKANEAFIKDSWSFPILSATPSNKGKDLLIKISGVHVATAPYQLTDRQVIATIPLASSVEPDDLVVTLGTEHTKFLTKDATPIPVDQNVVVK